jgi:hypothetical protein
MANDINIVVSAQVGDATRGLQQVQKQVQQVDRQIKQATVSLKQNANQFNSTAVSTNKFAKGALQQAGYQIGDFAVQLSGGQNALQAFGQQGSQMLGVFGPIGAVLGAAVAIFAAVGVAAQRAAEAAKETTVEIVSLDQAFTSLERINAAALGAKMAYPAEVAAEKYQALLDVIREVATEQRNAALSAIVESIAPAAAVAEIRTRFNEISRIRREIYDRGGSAGDVAFDRALKQQQEILAELVRESKVREIILSIQADTRSEAVENLNAAIVALNSAGLMTDELKAQLAAYSDQIGAVGQVTTETKELAEAAEIAAKSFGESLKNAISDIKLEMDGVASSAGLMARRMIEGAKAFMRAQIEARKARIQAAVDIANQRAGGGRGGAQGPGADQVERILMAMGGEDVGGNDTASTVNRATTVAKEAAKAVDMYVSPSFLRLQSIQEEVSSGIEDGFMSMIDGTKSVKDAFRSMASEIIKELYRIFVVKRITGMISGFIGGMSGVGMTNAPAANPLSGLSGSQMLPARAMGGQVTGGRAYMVGERGPEMIVPQRNGNVVPNNQLGGGVTVNQTINVSTGVQQTVRAEIKTLMPQIAEASKAAVADAVRRGGSYGRAFA